MENITGKQAFEAVSTSTNYPPYMVGRRAEDMIKLFLPPVEEFMMSMATPLPKDRVEWMKDYTGAQTIYINELTETKQYE